MGAAKAGVTVVVHDEKNCSDSLNSVLKDSGAKGLLFSPNTQVSEDGADRNSFLQKLMPQLQDLYPGDELNLDAYPNLKSIV